MAKVKSKSKPVHAIKISKRENRVSIGVCVPPGCTTRPTATFANHVYTIKITQLFKHVCVPLTVI